MQLRLVVSILSLLFTITFYSLRLSITFIQYAVFNDSFTEMYCVNTDKPELKCNGKCHLENELGDENSSSEPFFLDKNLHENIWLYSGNYNLSLKQKGSFMIEICPPQKLTLLYYFNYIETIFHPPII